MQFRSESELEENPDLMYSVENVEDIRKCHEMIGGGWRYATHTLAYTLHTHSRDTYPFLL
jgi:hypothetical protein